MDAIGFGIGFAIAIIIFLELFRFIRWLIKLPREIDDLKIKISNLEEVIKNSNE